MAAPTAARDMASQAKNAAPRAEMVRDADDEAGDANVAGKDGARDNDKNEPGKSGSRETNNEAPHAARKIHYNGAIKLEAASPEKVLDEAASRVKAAGGYVESHGAGVIALQVPVAAFAELFAWAQKSGKVLEKSLRALDVTDAYADAELRQRLTAASLRKLEELLEKASSAAERLALLREIGELKERLEQASAELAALAKLAKFSKLTLQVVAPTLSVAGLQATTINAFRWIDGLTPERSLASRLSPQTPRPELPMPQGYVILPSETEWRADSPTAATLRAVRLENEPEGDTRFWAEALKNRLQARFKVAGNESHGAFQVIRLKDRGNDAWAYDVGVLAKGKGLVIVEAFYPTAADEGRFFAPVVAALAAFDAKEFK